MQRAAMRAIADAGGSYQTEAGGPAWLKSLLGEAWCQDVVLVDLRGGADEEVLDHLFRLPRLSQLDVSGRAFSDRHLARLARFAELKEAVLTSTSVSRECVEALEQEQPDISLTIGLCFDELTGLPSGAGATDSAWQLDVPASVRRMGGQASSNRWHVFSHVGQVGDGGSATASERARPTAAESGHCAAVAGQGTKLRLGRRKDRGREVGDRHGSIRSDNHGVPLARCHAQSPGGAQLNLITDREVSAFGRFQPASAGWGFLKERFESTLYPTVQSRCIV